MTRPALLFLALLALVLTAGCMGLGGEPPVRQDRAVDVLESARDRTGQVDTYRFDVSFTAETSERSRRLDVGGRGRVNVTARKMAMNTTANGHSAAAFIDNDTVYEQCQPATFWGEEQFVAENWTAATPMGRTLALLSAGDLYYNGTERVDGTAVVRLSGRPPLEAFEKLRGEGAIDVPSGADFDRLTIDAWFDAETHHLRRSRLQISVSQGDQSGTANLTVDFHSYGKPVAVSVPADARDAFFENGCPD